MGAVSTSEAWPPPGRPITVADLDRMPDDGRRYELASGVLIVSPRPRMSHQVVALELAVLLRQSCPEDLAVVPEPAVQLSEDTEFDPDIIVVRREHVRQAKAFEPPLLAVEVHSPSTALIDLNIKKNAYEGFGVESYWMVTPDLDRPALTALELTDGRYEETARVSGDQAFHATRPFPVSFTPAQLVAPLR